MIMFHVRICFFLIKLGLRPYKPCVKYAPCKCHLWTSLLRNMDVAGWFPINNAYVALTGNAAFLAAPGVMICMDYYRHQSGSMMLS